MSSPAVSAFADPAVALTHRGVSALAAGQAAYAAACFTAATALAPHRPSLWHNRGEALRAMGRIAAAERAYRYALRLRPAYPKALAGFAMLLKASGRPNGAARALTRALAVDPAFAEGWSAVAILARERRERRAMTRLTAVLRRAVLLDPGNLSAWLALAGALSETAEACTVFDCLWRAVALFPGHSEGYMSYAGFLSRQGKLDEARTMHARLRRMAPLDGGADAGDSLIATLCGDFGRSVTLARRSLILQPGAAAAHINLALAEYSIGQTHRARRSNERAMVLQPANDVARFNLSMVLLALGDFRQGWQLYEARWQMERTTYPAYAPPWQGDDPAGRSFLLVAEQGQGDTLHFVRYAPLLAARGARVHLIVQPALVRLLLAVPGVASVRSFDDPPPACDVCVPLLSLPRLFGTTLATIPASIPYLSVADSDRRFWSGRLAGEKRLKVGLVWAGDAHRDHFSIHMVDKRRSLTLAALAPLAGIPEVAFYSIQKGPPAEQCRKPPDGLELTDWMDEVHDFAATAALVEQLDLVISVDTATCHLAGALARPVWVLSRYDACWRWLRDRSDSPWYPTLRLFRQDAPGEWGPVIGRVREALDKWVATRCSGPEFDGADFE